MSRLIKEMFQVNDIIKEEIAQAKHKYNRKIDFLNLHTRNAFTSGVVTILIIKYIYGFNYYKTQDKSIKDNISTNDCLRCSKIGIWEHIILYQKRGNFKLSLFKSYLRIYLK